MSTRQLSTKAVIAMVTCACLLYAQQVTNQLTITSPAPPPPSGTGSTATGPGSTTLYYWVIARYPSGASSPSASTAAFGTPGPDNLSASNYVRISWAPMANAIGYDVLRNTGPQYPAATGCAACAVVLNTAATTVDDTGAALSAYPPAGLANAVPLQTIWTVDNVSASTPRINVQYLSAKLNQSYRMPLVTGTPVNGNYAQFDADGNLQSSAGTATGPTGAGNSAGSANDIQASDGAGNFVGGRCTMNSSSQIVCTGGYSSGSGAPSLSGGTSGADAMAEGTAWTGCKAPSVGCIYADSSLHRVLITNNDSNYSPVAAFSDPLSSFAIAPLTTRGDLLTVNSTPALARLAAGGANTVLHGGTDLSYSAVVEGDLGLTDITTANSSTSAHGFLKKPDNTATNFMNGQGNWTGLTLAGAQFANQGTTTTLLHGNASGNPSWGSVATGDIAANAVGSGQMAVVNTRRVCDIAVGDTSGSAITDAQLGPQKRICFLPAASTVQEIDVAADGGTPNVIVAKNVAGTVTNLLSSALATAASGGIACSKTTAVTGIDGATTCSATLQNNTSIAAGSYLELVSGTAGGTAKLMTIHVIYTID